MIIFSFLLLIWGNNVSANALPIAHRGASAYAPENTISAIKKAIELRSPYIEIDVHMTKDGRVVALHDSSIDRTSNGKGDVSSFTLADLKKFDFGSWFDKKYQGEKIPTLEEVLKIVANQAKLIIELKYGHDRYNLIEDKIVSLVKRLKMNDQVILKSFNYNILEKFEIVAPGIERLYCTFGGNDWITIDNFIRFRGIFEHLTFQYLQVHKYFLNDSLIRKAHERNIKIIVWDVHDKKSIKKYGKMGVDYIESNNPDLVISTISSRDGE